MISSIFFQKLRYKKNNLTGNSQPFCGVQSGVVNPAFNCDCSNCFGFRGIAFFMIFSIFFQKN